MPEKKKPVPPLQLPKTKLVPYPDEIWKEYTDQFTHLRKRKYSISNFGRVASYYENIHVDGRLIHKKVALGKPINVNFSYFNPEPGNGRRNVLTYHRRIHLEVAKLFVPNDDPENKDMVVHLDKDLQNNEAKNLRWVNKDDYYAFYYDVKDAAEYQRSLLVKKGKGPKLTIAQVKVLKKRLREGKTRIRILAKQFGVSTTVIDHIKSGKYWGNIEI